MRSAPGGDVPCSTSPLGLGQPSPEAQEGGAALCDVITALRIRSLRARQNGEPGQEMKRATCEEAQDDSLRLPEGMDSVAGWFAYI
jgi:hypothetical protein